MEYANIINITRFCTDDGPGIRTTVFLKGCPLRCAWCHNPESQSPDPEILWDSEKCSSCGLCVDACAAGAHRITDRLHLFDPDKCTRCGRCAEACPLGALELSGRRVSTSEMLEEIKKDAVFYTASGGGVTVSGGEPLMHPDFTAELLRLCKEQGIHTAVETSGFAGRGALDKVLPYCDLILFDVKESREEWHKQYTGVPQAPIIDNLRYIDGKGIPTLLRAPIIPGLNDREEHLSELRELRDSLKNCQGLQIMPYHSMGAYKYKKLQRDYLCDGICEPDSATVANWRRFEE